jgi:hypothetical protein
VPNYLQIDTATSDIEYRLNNLNNVIESHIEESELLLLRLRTMKAKELETGWLNDFTIRLPRRCKLIIVI